MAAPKRTKFQIETDLERLSTLYCKGKYQHEIAHELGVSRSQVAYDIKKLQRRWRESSVNLINEAKQRELSRIDNLEREAWVAFEKSKEKLVQIKKRKMDNVQIGKNIYGDRTESSATTEERYGDPRFLLVIKECIAKRCQILGLDEPIKFEGEITEKQTFLIAGQTIEF